MVENSHAERFFRDLMFFKSYDSNPELTKFVSCFKRHMLQAKSNKTLCNSMLFFLHRRDLTFISASHITEIKS